jgi:hypothetical protein
MVAPPRVGITLLVDTFSTMNVEYVESIGPKVDAYSSVLTNVLLKSAYSVEIDDPPSIKLDAVATVDMIFDLYISSDTFE